MAWFQQVPSPTDALLLKWAAMDCSQRRGINIPGWIGAVCIAFMWLLMLAPKSMRVLLPVFDKLGPLSWVYLAMIVLPLIAAKRGSRWWLAVTAAGVMTLVAALRIALDPRSAQLAKNPDYAQNPSPQHTTALSGRIDGAHLRYGLITTTVSRH